MSRLTKKVGENYCSQNGDFYDLYNKLGKLEDLEEELGCSLKEIIEFIKLLKKYYYVDITGQLVARTIWNNTELNEKELYKINHIFNKIKDKSE